MNLRHHKFLKKLEYFLALLMAGISVTACGPLDGSGAPGTGCAEIAESKGEVIARRALTAFIAEVKRGDYGGKLGDGGKEISVSRVRDIRSEDVIYIGILDGEIENGEIYKFRIERIDEIRFGVAVFENCNTEVRWTIS